MFLKKREVREDCLGSVKLRGRIYDLYPEGIEKNLTQSRKIMRTLAIGSALSFGAWTAMYSAANGTGKLYQSMVSVTYGNRAEYLSTYKEAQSASSYTNVGSDSGVFVNKLPSAIENCIIENNTLESKFMPTLRTSESALCKGVQ